MLVVERVCICAVDLFILISGYFLCTSGKRRAVKVVELVMQVMLIGLVRYLLGCLLGREAFALKSMVGAMIPNNYFVTIYVALYLLSPYLNVLLDRLTDKQLGKLLALWLVLFSLWPTALNIFGEVTEKWYHGMYPVGTAGSLDGKTIVNFVTMYLLGAYLRRTQDNQWPFTGKVQGLCMLGLVVLLTLMQIPCPTVARSYDNPMVIAMAVLIFTSVRQIKLQSRLVNTLAKSALTCFLFHDFLLPYWISQQIVTGNAAVLLLHMLLTAAVLYLLCWVVWFIYERVTGPLRRWLEKLTCRADSIASI